MPITILDNSKLSINKKAAEQAILMEGIEPGSTRFQETYESFAKMVAGYGFVKESNGLNYHGKARIIVKPTQSGKSGLQRILMHYIGLVCKNAGIIWLTNISQTQLIEQSEGSLTTDRGFHQPLSTKLPVYRSITGSHVCPQMMSGGAVIDEDGEGRVKRAAIALASLGCTSLFIIVDEVHHAIKHGSQFDRFRTFLAKISGNLSLQANINIFGFTATPQIFLRADLQDGYDLEFVVLQGGSTYTSHQHLIDSGRIRPLQSFTHRVLASILKEHSKKPSYIIVRLPTKKEQHDQLLMACGAAGLPMPIEFSCGSDNDIKKFMERLAKRPLESQVLAVKDASRAGSDFRPEIDVGDVKVKLNLFKYVSCIIESRYKQEETVVQSFAGRATGHNVVDTFPIYLPQCNIEALEMHEAMMDYLNAGIVPEISKNNRHINVKYCADLNSVMIGTRKEYIHNCELRGVKPSSTSRYHKDGLWQAFTKSSIRAKHDRFFMPDMVFQDPVEEKARKLIIKALNLQPDQGFWFTKFDEQRSTFTSAEILGGKKR